MSSPPSQLRKVLLENGMDDDIPIPEAMSDPEVLAAAGATDPLRAVRDELTALVKEHRLLIYVGRWDEADPSLLSVTDAVALLREPGWYRYHADEPDEQRAYFGNVENISMAFFGYPELDDAN